MIFFDQKKNPSPLELGPSSNNSVKGFTGSKTPNQFIIHKEKIMKNIKEIRNQELTAKAEAEAKENRQNELEALEQKDAFNTIPEVAAGNIASDMDENEHLRGITGGKYVSRLVGGTVITAETKEELDAIEARMAEGIQGDGMLHKIVTIRGMKCEIQGRTQEELDEDYKRAEEAAYSFREHSMFSTVPMAEVLHNSEYGKDDGKDVTIRGRRVLILTKESRAVAPGSYETVADLEDLGKDLKLPAEAVEKLLTERLDKKFLEEDTAAATAYHDDCNDNDQFTLYVIDRYGELEEVDTFDDLDDAIDEGEEHRKYAEYVGYRIENADGIIVEEEDF